MSVRFGLPQASSHAVIHSDSASAGSAADLADPSAAAVTASGLVPGLVDVLSLVPLTSAVLHSLDLRSSAHLLLVYLSWFPDPFFLNETVLVFLTCLAIL